VINLAYFIVLFVLLEIFSLYEYIKKNTADESPNVTFERCIVLLLLFLSIIPLFGLAKKEYKDFQASS